MAEKDEEITWVMVNRGPVLTLWAEVVEVLGGQRTAPEDAQRG